MKPSDPKTKKPTRPLNLRSFPDELYWRCKVKAAEERTTLKEFIVRTLQTAMSK